MMHTDGLLSLGPCGRIQTHLTVCFRDTKLFQGLLNLWKYLGAFCMMFTLCWPCRSLGVVAVSNLVLHIKRFNAMLVVRWRSNQTFWCLPGLSFNPDSPGFCRFPEGRWTFCRSHLAWHLCRSERNSTEALLCGSALTFLLLKDYAESENQVTERFMLELDPHGSEHE